MTRSIWSISFAFLLNFILDIRVILEPSRGSVTFLKHVLADEMTTASVLS